MLALFFLANLVCSHSLWASVQGQDTPAGRNQLEEIFVWKVSDELKLTVSEEKSIADLLKRMSQQKSDFNHELKVTVEALAALNGKADSKSQHQTQGQAQGQAQGQDPLQQRRVLLTRYRNALEKMNKLNLSEVDEVQKILGVKRTGQYLVIKNELLDKVKSYLKVEKEGKDKDKATNTDKKVWPKPKIIEEK